ncbi:MAG: DnaJ-class molecular chaperone with C-terminal Zn finger domain [Fibrobacteres bacterium]|nr:DnaJ-class molecular chaperone with C-terminal Zn finger domain [Fibrobacterota bacterium]
MEFKDYYKTLGLEKGADADAVKKAYRKLAGKYHPDKNPGSKTAEDRFKEINEANEVLSDPEKKKRYDELGANWNQQGGPDGAYDWRQYAGQGAGGGRGRTRTFTQDDLGDIFGGEGGGGFSDFFETFFGGAGMAGGAGPGRGRQGGAWTGRQPPRPGDDYQADVEITLEEAYHGAKKIIEINGKKLRLQFKPGIADGKAIKLAGKGGKGMNGGPDGDFYLRIHVQPHPVLERRGDDLHMVLRLEVQDAVVGKTEEIQTLGGGVKLRIPPETDNGKVFRLKGQGMPVYDKPGEHGDLYVTVALALPKNLKTDEIEFFRQMAEARRK